MKVIGSRSVNQPLIALYIYFLALCFSSISAKAECYYYDKLGRLESVVYDNANSAKRTYNLDEHGNRNTVDVDLSSAINCLEPSGNIETGSGGPITNALLNADDENITVLINTSVTVYPVEGDGGNAPSLDANSITPTSSSFFSSITQVGNSVVFTALGIATTTPVVFSYNVTDATGATDTGNINVTVSDTTDPTLPPIIPLDPQCPVEHPNYPLCE